MMNTGAYPSGLSIDRRLAVSFPDLELLLIGGKTTPALVAPSDIRRATVWVTTRDGTRLATDLYLPPSLPAPAIAVRTPYGRAETKQVATFLTFAQQGYVVISQDCRGTGMSEPDSWDYYVYEREDSFDFVDWVTRQPWFNGFLAGCGGSYLAQTQWCMAFHPKMSTIVPEVGGLGVAFRTARHYMFLNAYSRSVGKGIGKVAISYEAMEREMVEETLAGGYFNEPLHRSLPEVLLERYPTLRTIPPAEGRRWLWRQYCSLSPGQRAELIQRICGEPNVTSSSVEALPEVFGHDVAHDAHMFPCVHTADLARSLQTPALMVTGWYDWGLNDALATWDLLKREAPKATYSRCRLLISPSAHNKPGYHEGREAHPELERTCRTADLVDVLLNWYHAARNDALETWPRVIYYLMGANEWHCDSEWPPQEARIVPLHLNAGGDLTLRPPSHNSSPDTYIYRPDDPTPTVGGCIVSYVYTPGSADVSEVQKRSDVLTYTTEVLERDLDVVGPLRLIVYASSSAIDTDFSARLSDVFPDGRAIQIQSGMLRTRYRNPSGDPEFLEPDRIYRLEIDMWATANRFRTGHRVRLDISSADFPNFDRNTNLGGVPGAPMPATQRIYHGPDHPSHLLLSVLGNHSPDLDDGSVALIRLKR